MSRIPVPVRMKNVARVRVPRYHVTLKSRDRRRILTEARCRKTFCWTDSALCRLLEPAPLRNTERQTFVPRSSFHQQIAFIADRNFQPGKRPGRGPVDLHAEPVELAAVAGAGDDAELRLP